MRGPSPFCLQGLCHPGLAGTAVPRTTIVGLFSLYNLVHQFRHGHSVADARFWMSVFHSSNVVFDRRMLAGCMGCTWLAALVSRLDHLKQSDNIFFANAADFVVHSQRIRNAFWMDFVLKHSRRLV